MDDEMRKSAAECPQCGLVRESDYKHKIYIVHGHVDCIRALSREVKRMRSQLDDAIIFSSETESVVCELNNAVDAIQNDIRIIEADAESVRKEVDSLVKESEAVG